MRGYVEIQVSYEFKDLIDVFFSPMLHSNTGQWAYVQNLKVNEPLTKMFLQTVF